MENPALPTDGLGYCSQGLVQNSVISNALALEMWQSCIEPLMSS